MSQDSKLFEIAIEYINDNSKTCQADFLRKKLGESSNSSQVEFSKYCVASSPKWQDAARFYREKGIKLKCSAGSYKESVFKRALKLYDYQRRNAAKKAPSKRESQKTNDGEDEAAAPKKKKRKTRAVSDKTGKNENEIQDETVAPPDFTAIKVALESLFDSVKRAHEYHVYVSKSLADERKASMVLRKEIAAFEAQMDEVSESLDDESRSCHKLKTVNKRLRDDLRHCSKASEELVRKCNINKQLSNENARLKQDLENTNALLEGTRSYEAPIPEGQRIAKDQQLKRNSDLCEKLNALTDLHQRATENLSFQTGLLQEERQRRAMLQEKLEKKQSSSTTGNATDRSSARRISL
eukprot:scaffold11809_cov128-Cylindrotheca_fusiformis.AAC.27